MRLNSTSYQPESGDLPPIRAASRGDRPRATENPHAAVRCGVVMALQSELDCDEKQGVGETRMHAINGKILGLAVSVVCLAACGPSPEPHTVPASPPPAPSTPTAAAMSPMPAIPGSIDDWAKGAHLFEGLGDFHRKIATKSPEAQRYFDQGMRFLWAFNHDESTRSFARAAQLDPVCAACYWGVALTVGPNYNLPVMAPVRAQVAFDALTKAQNAAAHASPADRALIGALAK